jgi:succinate dehydrogenase/fumarate reductase flavoprotein subunit
MTQSVIVVGSGAAGLAAALSAACRGARVTLLETAGLIGGTTTYSGGVAWVPANEVMLAAGLDDSPEAALTYLRSLDIGDRDDDLCQLYVDQARTITAEVARQAGFDWIVSAGPDYHAERPGGKMGGRSLEPAPAAVGAEIAARVREAPNYVPSTYAEAVAGKLPDAAELARRRREGVLTRGRGLAGVLLRAALSRGVDVRTGVRARSLLLRDGAVAGLATQRHGELEGEVILASGGFERDPGLVRSFLRGPMLAPGGNPYARGDGLRMAMAAGAALGNMSEAHWCPGIALPDQVEGHPYFWMAFSDRARPGSLTVNALGRRFADEGANYCDFTRAMHAFEPAGYWFPNSPAWMVFDGRFRARYPVGPLRPGQPDAGWLRRAETVRELAGAIGVPADALEVSVREFNQLAAAGRDTAFGRGDYPHDRSSGDPRAAHPSLAPLDEPPFYAAELLPGCLGTRGGPKIDRQARVQRADGGGPIPGLYAAGNAAASIFGYAYPGAGGTIGPALVFGWLAGQAAAA